MTEPASQKTGDQAVEDRRRFVDEHQAVLDESGRRSRIARARRSGSALASEDELRRPWSERSRGSRALHRLGAATARPAFGVAVGLVVCVWLVLGAFMNFPGWWQVVLYSVSSSVTLLMVFVIQHTQSHQQMATQRKLDEILRAVPAADDRLISAETATDGELKALAALNLADRSRVVTDVPLN